MLRGSTRSTAPRRRRWLVAAALPRSPARAADLGSAPPTRPAASPVAAAGARRACRGRCRPGCYGASIVPANGLTADRVQRYRPELLQHVVTDRARRWQIADDAAVGRERPQQRVPAFAA